MVRYVVTDLLESTPQEKQQQLKAALEEIEGIGNVALDTTRKEVSFRIAGVEPKLKHLQEACTVAGFTLGMRM